MSTRGKKTGELQPGAFWTEEIPQGPQMMAEFQRRNRAAGESHASGPPSTLMPMPTADGTVRSVDDWLKRLDNLFNRIKIWAAANGWTADDGPPVPMREEIMRLFKIGKRPQPTLSVLSPEGAKISIKPKGLWVIGANGRVDIYSSKGVFTLVDVADPFKAPKWVLHRVGQSDGRPFDPKQLAEMI